MGLPRFQVQPTYVCRNGTTNARCSGRTKWLRPLVPERETNILRFFHFCSFNLSEVAAENLRQLARTIEQRLDVREKRQQIYETKSQVKTHFGDQPESQVWTLIKGFGKQYLHDLPPGDNDPQLCSRLSSELEDRIPRFSADQLRYYWLLDVKARDVAGKVDDVRIAALELVGQLEPLIDERLEVLQAAASLADKLNGPDEVTCPACGQTVSVDAFQAHVQAEQTRLKDIIERFNRRRAALSVPSDAVKATTRNLGRSELATWREDQRQAGGSCRECGGNRRRGCESMVVGVRRRGQGRWGSARGSASRRPGAW